jgi:hypothetical protein
VHLKDLISLDGIAGGDLGKILVGNARMNEGCNIRCMGTVLRGVVRCGHEGRDRTFADQMVRRATTHTQHAFS